MVPKGGLEPPRVAPHAPQTCASANSATSARARAKYAARPSALSTRRASSTPARLSQPRVEGIADALAEQVVGQHRDQDRQAGVERHPPRDLDRVLAVVQDVAPGRIRRLHPEA